MVCTTKTVNFVKRSKIVFIETNLERWEGRERERERELFPRRNIAFSRKGRDSVWEVIHNCVNLEIFDYTTLNWFLSQGKPYTFDSSFIFLKGSFDLLYSLDLWILL